MDAGFLYVLREVFEGVVNDLLGVGPRAVAVGIVGGPHDVLEVAQLPHGLRAPVVDNEAGVDLALEVLGGKERELEVGEAAVVGVVHAFQHEGEPTYATLAEDGVEPRVAFQDAREDKGTKHFVGARGSKAEADGGG